MLKSGDKLIVVIPFRTFAKKDYEDGMILELIEPTGRAPFKAQSRICNWVVKCPFFCPPDDQAVWSGIWMLVEGGWILKIEED